MRWPLYLLMTCLLGGSAIMLSLWLSRVNMGELALNDFNSYRCDRVHARGDGEFHLLTLTPVNAREIADRLCRNATHWDGIGAFRITWQPRTFLTAPAIVAETYDLFLNREHLVRGMVPRLDDFYLPVLEPPAYHLYWMSLREPPQADPEWFAKQRVGLLEDPGSQTFFLAPTAWLREAGIELSPDQLHFYPDIPALFAAFLDGEVNLISGEPVMLRQMHGDSTPPLSTEGAKVHTLLINEQLTPGTWFISRQRAADPGLCHLLSVLRELDAFPDLYPPGFAYHVLVPCG